MNENIGYWLLSIMFLLLPPIFYGLFRYHIYSWLRKDKHLSKTKIRKAAKGLTNYWWYESLHQEIGLGAIYWLNKIFTILFPVTFLLTVLTGWIHIMSVPICILTVFIYLLTLVIFVFSRILYNLSRHNSPIVFWGKSENNGIDSFFLDLLIAAFFLVAAYAHLIATCDLWGIEFPHL